MHTCMAQLSLLELLVPGLLERRPAVVYGDCIRFRFSAFLESVVFVVVYGGWVGGWVCERASE